MHGLAAVDDLLALPPLEKFSGKVMKVRYLALWNRFPVRIHGSSRTAFG